MPPILKKVLEYLLVLVLLSPLILINQFDIRGWGDDYTAYLLEGQNIAEGKPYYETTFEFYDYNMVYAPPYYAYGYPLLLAPVIKVRGMHIPVLIAYMAFWMLAWALLIYVYLRRYFSLFASLCFTLIFFLNPFFFDFKSQILSDVPFAFFFTLSLILYLQRKGKPIWYFIIAGLVLAFMVGIRSIGIIMLPVIFAELAWQFIRYRLHDVAKDDFKLHLKENGFILLSSATFIFLLNNVLFKAPQNLIGHFIQVYASDNYYNLVLHNLWVYTYEFRQMFDHDSGHYGFTMLFTTSLLLVFFIIGLVRLPFIASRFEIAMFVLYTILILLFPYSTQGFRYLFPVLPIIIFCIALGARHILRSTRPGYKYALGTAMVVVMLLQYKREIKTFAYLPDTPIENGPFAPSNQEMMDYIKSHVPDSALIVTPKPRAVALFTGKRTCVYPDQGIMKAMKEINPSYVLVLNGAPDPALQEMVADSISTLVLETAGSSLYKVKKAE